MTSFIKINLILLLFLGTISSCVSKRNVLYMQDYESYKETTIVHTQTSFQVDDVLKITVGALNPDAALPYNITSPSVVSQNIELVKLDGYLVSQKKTINFPVLGEISVADKTPATLRIHIQELLKKGGYLTDPTVTIRLLNAKFTILGQVGRPGTYTFTENSISLLQALGLAGDLNITGKRKDVLIIRESGGKRTINSLDLTSAEWISGPFQNIQPNDVILVNPNTAKIKSGGIVGNASTIVGIASVILSSIIVLSN
jgi:polysaccharide export outer membrane protein